MSNQRSRKRIQINKDLYLELRPGSWALALLATALSALSVSVFCFMRSSPEAELYYTGERSLMLFDSLGLATLLSAALLALLFVLLTVEWILRKRAGLS